MTGKLYHFGYQGQDTQSLARFVEQHDAVVCDVRFKPWSQAPQWRRQSLQELLGDRYIHVPELGNRNYRGGPIELVDPLAGLDAIEATLHRGRSVVIMCMCSDFMTCHRRQVIELLDERGYGPPALADLSAFAPGRKADSGLF